MKPRNRIFTEGLVGAGKTTLCEALRADRFPVVEEIGSCFGLRELPGEERSPQELEEILE